MEPDLHDLLFAWNGGDLDATTAARSLLRETARGRRKLPPGIYGGTADAGHA